MSQVSNVVSEKNKLLIHKISYLIQSLAGKEQELGLASIDLRAGETLIEQDATDNNIYLVCSGRLGVRKRMPDGNIKDIGVDVVLYRERRRFYDIDTCVSGWRVLLNKMNPFSKNLKTPSLVEILMRTLEVNATSSSREQTHLTDLLIQPDTRGYGPDAYDKWKPLAERGYEASIEKLVEWKSRQTL